MARPTVEACNPEIFEKHINSFLNAREEDKLLEDFFDSKRVIPSPLEISIYQRQLRNDPERIRIKEENIEQRIRLNAGVMKITKLTTTNEFLQY